MGKHRKRLLVIDGYNVLRSGSRYKTMRHPDHVDEPFNAPRDRLINDVIAYAGSELDAIVVFDAAEGSHESITTDKIGKVEVIFSPIGQSADRIIEKIAHDARENMIETVVVTSDATIQDTVFAGCVTRMSAEGFCRALAVCDDDPLDYDCPSGYEKNTVQDRVPKDIANKLKALRDSL